MEAMEHHHNHTDPLFNKLGLPEHFGGHIVPGVMQYLIGLRWLYCTFERYYLCKREYALLGSRGRPFVSSYLFPSTFCPGLPLEALVTFLLSVLLIIMESQSAISHVGVTDMRFGEDLIHVVMVAQVALAPIVVILKHYRYPVIDGMEYFVSGSSYLIMAYTAYNHVLHPTTLGKQVHTQVNIVWVLMAVTMFIESQNLDKPLFPVIRAFWLCYAGGLFVQLDFILFDMNGGSWPTENGFYLLLELMTLTWHFVGELLVVGVVSFVALVLVKRMKPAKVKAQLDISLGCSYGGQFTDEKSGEVRYCLLKNCDDV
ncbi:uncharacterized protein LOC108669380 [Hyalella azteca]|uniref:Uncharacterized protein LOC108669380 n=1 Tax=Hyalella azteca TaxID=294128 RepID=A0A8B7NF02_HYAAZ|nr:uncharacterized protein LOC108669380 [Hyalella azteca]